MRVRLYGFNGATTRQIYAQEDLLMGTVETSQDGATISHEDRSAGPYALPRIITERLSTASGNLVITNE
jgi:hypothetical protein